MFHLNHLTFQEKAFFFLQIASYKSESIDISYVQQM